ncbi:hypothetical protein LIER_21732 [Lithospermum erythrorhizon]|uniref:Uncharacterized protein n=1 Tax=Lithospermum erythrorhizon TaxID=34254 RepID=A0AAV3QSH9_LITER
MNLGLQGKPVQTFTEEPELTTNFVLFEIQANQLVKFSKPRRRQGPKLHGRNLVSDWAVRWAGFWAEPWADVWAWAEPWAVVWAWAKPWADVWAEPWTVEWAG